MMQMHLSVETETDSQTQKNRPVVARWERGGEGRTGSLISTGANHYI